MKRFSVILIALVAAVAPMAAADVHESGVERVTSEASQPTVKIDGNIMVFYPADATAPVRFEIFSVTGQLIKVITVKGAPVKVELPKGFYIVKCDSWTRRVMLK